MSRGFTRREFIAAAAVSPLFARAAPAAVTKRLGILAHGRRDESLADFDVHDRKSLADRGWIEGKTLAIEWRFAEGDDSRFEALARQLVEAKVDVIATASTARTRAVLRATRAIPVFTAVGDPVGAGFATSLSRPGGNVTGLALGTPEIGPRQVELLRTVVPRLSRITVLSSSSPASMRVGLAPLLESAEAARLAIDLRQVASAAEVQAAFSTLSRGGRNAVFVGNLPSGVDGAAVARLAIRHGVATISPEEEFVRQGGLMSFNLEFDDVGGRSAAIIDKLLRGADPATTPFELPSRSRLVINRRTAAAIGVTFPADFAIRADQIVD